MREQQPTLSNRRADGPHLRVLSTSFRIRPRHSDLLNAHLLSTAGVYAWGKGVPSGGGEFSEMFRVIHGVMEGRVHGRGTLPFPAAVQLFGPGTQPAPASRITEREAQVIRLLARGRSNKEIGIELCIHEQTVKKCQPHPGEAGSGGPRADRRLRRTARAGVTGRTTSRTSAPMTFVLLGSSTIHPRPSAPRTYVG